MTHKSIFQKMPQSFMHYNNFSLKILLDGSEKKNVKKNRFQMIEADV